MAGEGGARGQCEGGGGGSMGIKADWWPFLGSACTVAGPAGQNFSLKFFLAPFSSHALFLQKFLSLGQKNSNLNRAGLY